MLEDKPLSAPSPLPTGSDVNAPLAQHLTPVSNETIVTNPLDESQALILQREEHALIRAQIANKLKAHQDYVFTPPSVEERLRQVGDQSLVSWNICTAASSPEEIANG